MLLELALALTLSPAPLAPVQEAVDRDRTEQRVERLRERATQLEQGTAPDRRQGQQGRLGNSERRGGEGGGFRRGRRGLEAEGRGGLGQGRLGPGQRGLGQRGLGRRGQDGARLTPEQREKLRGKLAEKLRERVTNGRNGRAGGERGNGQGQRGAGQNSRGAGLGSRGAGLGQRLRERLRDRRRGSGEVRGPI